MIYNTEKNKSGKVDGRGAANVVQLPVIVGVEINTDSEGRFNLNSLHKAHLKKNPSLHKNSKQPADWLKLEGTKELIGEIFNSEDLHSSPVSSTSGRYGGTFVHEILAVAYAGWISPAFQLMVNQTFIDFRSGRLQPVAPQLSRIDILKIAMQAEEENLRLTAEVKSMVTTVNAFDRIANGEASLTITSAAKDLQVKPKDLFGWLSQHKWVYRRAGGNSWIGYQDKIQSGLVEHKVTTVQRADGSDKTVEQVRLTAKGLAKISKLFDQEAA